MSATAPMTSHCDTPTSGCAGEIDAATPKQQACDPRTSDCALQCPADKAWHEQIVELLIDAPPEFIAWGYELILFAHLNDNGDCRAVIGAHDWTPTNRAMPFSLAGALDELSQHAYEGRSRRAL